MGVGFPESESKILKLEDQASKSSLAALAGRIATGPHAAQARTGRWESDRWPLSGSSDRTRVCERLRLQPPGILAP